VAEGSPRSGSEEVAAAEAAWAKGWASSVGAEDSDGVDVWVADLAPAGVLGDIVRGSWFVCRWSSRRGEEGGGVAGWALRAAGEGGGTMGAGTEAGTGVTGGGGFKKDSKKAEKGGGR
jgi:hypothetical protein